MRAESAPPAEAPDVLDTSEAGSAAIQGGALRVIGYGAGVLMSIGSAALLFRHLGVEQSGRYITALTLVTIAGSLSDLGLTGIGVRELSVADHAGRHMTMRALVGLRSTVTTISLVAVTVFAILAGYPSEVVVGTALAGIAILLITIQGTLATGLVVQLRLGWVTATEFVRQFALVLGIVILVIVGASFVPFLAIQIPAALISLVLTIALVRGHLPIRPTFRWTHWRGLVKEILPFALASTLGAIYFRVAIILLSLVSTAHETGYFSVSYRIIEVLLAVPALLVTAAFPILARAARDDHERLSYGVQRIFETGLVGGTALAIALGLGAPIAIRVVAGPDFAPAAGILRIQAIALAAMFVTAGWGYALLSLGRYREILLLSVSGVALSITLVAIFGSLYGAHGAAWAAAGVDVFQTILLGFVLARVNAALRPDLRVVPRVALAAGGAIALAAIPGIPTIALAVCGTLVYVSLVFALHAVPQEIIVELQRVRRRASGLVGRQDKPASTSA